MDLLINHRLVISLSLYLPIAMLTNVERSLSQGGGGGGGGGGLVLQGVFTFDVLVGCIVDRIVSDLTIKCNWS